MRAKVQQPQEVSVEDSVEGQQQAASLGEYVWHSRQEMLTGWNNGWREVRTPTVWIRNVGKETAEWISLTVMPDKHLADLNPKKNGHKRLVRFREHSRHKPEEKATSLKTREQKVKGQRLTVQSNTTLGPRADIHHDNNRMHGSGVCCDRG